VRILSALKYATANMDIPAHESSQPIFTGKFIQMPTYRRSRVKEPTMAEDYV
jgi:hypothetical protein